jgi:hypothetical protein
MPACSCCIGVGENYNIYWNYTLMIKHKSASAHYWEIIFFDSKSCGIETGNGVPCRVAVIVYE